MKPNASLKDAAVTAAVEQVLRYLEKDPEANIPRIMKLVDTVTPKDWYAPQRAAFRKAIEEKSNWYQLILKAYELDPGVRQTFFRNFILNASLLGSARQDEVSRKENCNVPWAILLDPTSACNRRCTGCWAAEYGDRLNLSFAELIPSSPRARNWAPICTSSPRRAAGAQKGRYRPVRKHSDCEF